MNDYNSINFLLSSKRCSCCGKLYDAVFAIDKTTPFMPSSKLKRSLENYSPHGKPIVLRRRYLVMSNENQNLNIQAINSSRIVVSPKRPRKTAVTSLLTLECYNCGSLVEYDKSIL